MPGYQRPEAPFYDPEFDAPPAATGAELLAMLSALSQEELKMPVSMEGCDCYGDFGSLEVCGEGNDRYISLERTKRP